MGITFMVVITCMGDTVVVYMLYQLRTICGDEIGLYRDDGLAVFHEPLLGMEKKNKKNICQWFTN